MLSVAAKIFGCFVKRRNSLYDRGKKQITRLSTPVISVGNISLGGSGKTPLMELLAKILLDNKLKPALVGRGYHRKYKNLSIVSDGESIFADEDSAGDEMLMLAHKLNVPVVVNKSKTKAALICEEKFKPDAILIDDGFQHRKLHRNSDIVLVSRSTMENPWLFPKGRLRELPESLQRADIICQAGDELDIRKYLTPLKKIPAIFKSEIRALPPYPLYEYPGKIKSDTSSPLSTGTLEPGVKLIAMCGIAEPERFPVTIQSLGYNVEAMLNFKDHHNYKTGDLLEVKNLCDKFNIGDIAVTEKDAVKLKKFTGFFREMKINCFVFPVEIYISDGFSVFSALIIDIIKDFQRNKQNGAGN